jgi:hypothetical protein
MKEIMELLKATKEDTFAITVFKRIIGGYLRVGILGITLFVRLTSTKDELQKFKQELGV